ncbi:hypothetical protein F383_34817 [Gossypium arboreum]|uniref:Uncharacterized protein n=1 Tax=Gossypium arboreum TaxID=29729 RepID=A0A0B0N605_GOSAR|nr:hypothetical protein F383_34359 [Gossypium arboreum]KHG28801.1 hypothetical protein F383_34817 [Gossypium arboreum]
MQFQVLKRSPISCSYFFQMVSVDCYY